MGCVDPFHPICRGSKIPDDNSFPSVAVTASLQRVYQLDADGDGAIAYTYAPRNGAELPSAIAGSQITWGGGTASVTNYTEMNSVFDASRTVSFGIRITCPLPITVAQGYVYIALVPDNYATGHDVANWPKTSDEFRMCLWHAIVPLAELCDRPFIVASKRVDNSSYRYRTFDGQPATIAVDEMETCSGWSTIVTAVFGGPPSSLSALMVEYVSNLEVLPKPTGTFPGITAETSPIDRLAIDNAKAVDSAAPVGFLQQVADTSYEVLHSAMAEGATLFKRIAPSLGSMAMRAGVRVLGNAAARYGPSGFVHPKSYITIKQQEQDYAMY